MNQTSNPLRLTGFGLKYIAMFAMAIDHVGAVFILGTSPLYNVFRGIGRIAFPVFCFLLVEGYMHTSNKQAYFRRLLMFAFISEIPFDMAFFHFPATTSWGTLTSHQNVFFTLAFAFLAMYLLDKYWYSNQMLGFLWLIGIGFVAEFLSFDYGFTGVIVVMIFFICKKYRPEISALWAGVIACVPLLSIGYWTSFCVLLAVPLILLYDGTKGSALPGGASFPGDKYLFYAFYPVHLVVLGYVWFLVK